jgi:hypothetical protein
MVLKYSTLAAILVATSLGLTHAQGISTRRDAAGNIPRDNGIASQNAPRPMTNNASRTVQGPTYVSIGRTRPISIPIRRAAVRSGGLR